MQQQPGFAEDLQSYLLQTAVQLLAEPAGQVGWALLEACHLHSVSQEKGNGCVLTGEK